MNESQIMIRPLETWDEFLAVEELERRVWQMPDWRDAVPSNLLITIQKNGGIVLGAFDQQVLVGFVFSFIGAEGESGKTRLKHCSHMLAVAPEYQARQIGARLKFAQREAALAQQIDLITWTYDPLQARNANLNLVRLGAIARRYIPNAYGEMTDGLNAGLPSDRFQVEWWLNDPRVHARANRERADLHSREPESKGWDDLVRSGAQEIFEFEFGNGIPRIARMHDPLAEILLAEIPADLRTLKSISTEQAREIRMHTRQLFTHAFALGYAATDFLYATRDGIERAAYVLTRQPAGTAADQ